MDHRRILITGAAGNLGGLLAKHLALSGHRVRCMVHRTPMVSDLPDLPTVETVQADLADPDSLAKAVTGVDTVVHFAGVLFAPHPEKFLLVTNTRWFSNLLDACLNAGVSRIILISFPHVEGPTTPEAPATGRLDGHPVSAHATTRLQEEILLMDRTEGTSATPVILRLGMVYSSGILMIDAARWMARRGLLGVWKDPTWIHLISTPDYLAATEAAAIRPGINGIYHVGDDQPVTLQQFLDKACDTWGYRRPRRIPIWMIYTASALCELYAGITGSRSPLTRDFIKIGRVPYCGDTGRAREELIPELQHPTLEDGLHLMK